LPPKYKNPPVIEALIFIGVVPSTSPIERLEAVVPGVPIRYPNRQSVAQTGFTIDLQNPKEATTTAQQLGYSYSDETNTRVVQIRRDGFVFSRLTPYPYSGWDEWTAEAIGLWNRYKEVVSPQSVNLLQVRYANRIRIPQLRFLPQEYLNAYPWISTALPPMNGFVLRVEFPAPTIPGARLVINQGTLYDPTEPQTASILLDLEVSKSGVELEPKDPNVWQTIEELHRLETSAFEACITDKSREVFNR
jgi:uncharacterized protein (TIGR04255 family)